MAKVINRKTGISYAATKEQVEAIRSNEMTAGLYDIVETEEPAEVKALKDKETKPAGSRKT